MYNTGEQVVYCVVIPCSEEKEYMRWGLCTTQMRLFEFIYNTCTTHVIFKYAKEGKNIAIYHTV